MENSEDLAKYFLLVETKERSDEFKFNFTKDENYEQLQFIGLMPEENVLESVDTYNYEISAEQYYEMNIYSILESLFQYSQSLNRIKNNIKLKVYKLKAPHLLSRSQKIKNCARYLIQGIIHQLPSYKPWLSKVCNFADINCNQFFSFFKQNFTKFSSLHNIRDFWIIEETQLQNLSLIDKYKLIFKYFCKLFLKYKGKRHVLLGKMADKKSYLETIKQMLFYIDHPENYRSNLY